MTVTFDVTDKITVQALSGAWYEVHVVRTALIPKWDWMRRPAGKLEVLASLLGLLSLRTLCWVRRPSGWSVLVFRATEFPTDVPISEQGTILGRLDFATRYDALPHAQAVRESIAAGRFEASHS